MFKGMVSALGQGVPGWLGGSRLTGYLTQTSSTSIGQGQYLGTNTNDNATAGNIGEYTSASITSSLSVAIGPNVAISVNSIDLPAGDWNIYANLVFAANATPTSPITTIASISTSSNSNASSYPERADGLDQLTTNGQITLSVFKRATIASSASFYLVGYMNYVGASGGSGWGGMIARRVR